MLQDKAETGRLEELLARVGAGLDQYLQYEHTDASTRRESWSAALEQAVPQQGVGIDAVVNELMEQVVPNGSSAGRGLPHLLPPVVPVRLRWLRPPPVWPRHNATCKPHSTCSRN